MKFLQTDRLTVAEPLELPLWMMKKVTITINSEVYEIQDLGEQQLSSTHLRSDICYHFCDLFKQCSKFLYNAATPCLLAMDHPDEGTGFYFKKKEL